MKTYTTECNVSNLIERRGSYHCTSNKRNAFWSLSFLLFSMAIQPILSIYHIKIFNPNHQKLVWTLHIVSH